VLWAELGGLHRGAAAVTPDPPEAGLPLVLAARLLRAAGLPAAARLLRAARLRAGHGQ
jgi:hypothetical protein